MTDKSKFHVTGTAGDWVAGKRSPGEGKPIELTEAQAVTPLRNGEITVEKPAAVNQKPESPRNKSGAGSGQKKKEAGSK